MGIARLHRADSYMSEDHHAFVILLTGQRSVAITVKAQAGKFGQGDPAFARPFLHFGGGAGSHVGGEAEAVSIVSPDPRHPPFGILQRIGEIDVESEACGQQRPAARSALKRTQQIEREPRHFLRKWIVERFAGGILPRRQRNRGQAAQRRELGIADSARRDHNRPDILPLVRTRQYQIGRVAPARLRRDIESIGQRHHWRTINIVEIARRQVRSRHRPCGRIARLRGIGAAWAW